jgi:hypothetical protein
MTQTMPPLLVAMAGGKPRPRRFRAPVPKEIKLHIPVADLLKDHCFGKYRVIYADPPWKYNDALAISKDGTGESYGPADA